MPEVDVEKANRAVELITREMMRATRKHAPMHSWHEAHSIIREEFEEFWTEVMKGGGSTGPRDPIALRTELTHMAAMCLRAMHDLCENL